MINEVAQRHALDAVGKGKGKGRGDGKCYTCGKQGHCARDCAEQENEDQGSVSDCLSHNTKAKKNAAGKNAEQDFKGNGSIVDLQATSQPNAEVKDKERGSQEALAKERKRWSIQHVSKHRSMGKRCDLELHSGVVTRSNSRNTSSRMIGSKYDTRHMLAHEPPQVKEATDNE